MGEAGRVDKLELQNLFKFQFTHELFSQICLRLFTIPIIVDYFLQCFLRSSRKSYNMVQRWKMTHLKTSPHGSLYTATPCEETMFALAPKLKTDLKKDLFLSRCLALKNMLFQKLFMPFYFPSTTGINILIATRYDD